MPSLFSAVWCEAVECSIVVSLGVGTMSSEDGASVYVGVSGCLGAAVLAGIGAAAPGADLGGAWKADGRGFERGDCGGVADSGCCGSVVVRSVCDGVGLFMMSVDVVEWHSGCSSDYDVVVLSSVDLDCTACSGGPVAEAVGVVLGGDLAVAGSAEVVVVCAVWLRAVVSGDGCGSFAVAAGWSVGPLVHVDVSVWVSVWVGSG